MSSSRERVFGERAGDAKFDTGVYIHGVDGVETAGDSWVGRGLCSEYETGDAQRLDGDEHEVRYDELSNCRMGSFTRLEEDEDTI